MKNLGTVTIKHRLNNNEIYIPVNIAGRFIIPKLKWKELFENLPFDENNLIFEYGCDRVYPIWYNDNVLEINELLVPKGNEFRVSFN
jgi:hypothetical protein